MFEKDDRLGGLLRYGIPDFKLEKHILDRRLEQMVAEGVQVRAERQRGRRHPAAELARTVRRDRAVHGRGPAAANFACPGRELAGRPFRHGLSAAAEPPRRRATRIVRTAGRAERSMPGASTSIVVGGGDTGSDCVGTAIRQGARSVTQLEILPRPPDGYNPETPWPFWPKIMRTSSSQEEGCQRRWSTLTKALTGTRRPR